MIAGYEIKAIEARAAREARADIEDFHNLYCDTLDLGDLDLWPGFFTEDALYVVIARENVEANLPAGLVYAEGRAMIRDRAFAIKNTMMFAPRYLQHFVTNVTVLSIDGEQIRARSNYLLLQTLVEGPTTMQQAGRYYDTFVRGPERLIIKERHCVYDSTLIANDLIMPV
ncbi:MAG: ring-hydroxylating dioxygenase subunit beta [Betaproteobacteria bacterium]|nr:ring-hydroxylating dioxygenase subunit beta [Betaproteobacteria bacterium]